VGARPSGSPRAPVGTVPDMATEAKPNPVSVVEDAVAGYSDEAIPLAAYAAVLGVYGAAFAGALLAARASGCELPRRLPAGDLVVFGTATHKLSRLLAKGKVTSVLRAPFTEYERQGGPAEVEERPRGGGFRRAIAELLVCPYCLDQWVATGFVSGAVLAPRVTRLVAGVFATGALADFLQLAYRAGQERDVAGDRGAEAGAAVRGRS
jgi:Protein of unknown function (DUF1360)